MEIANLGKIKNLVVLMFENRSFDHLLGSLPGVRGIHDPGATTAGPMSQCGVPERVSVFTPDPPHGLQAVGLQINNGRMDGFVDVFTHPPDDPTAQLPRFPEDITRYYTETELPITYFLARKFAVCDNYFCSVPTSTMPNRLYSIAGTSGGHRDTPIKDPAVNVETIFDLLDTKGVSWNVYCGGLSMLMLVGNVGRKLHYLTHIRSHADFATDCVNGRLPTLSWIEPNYDWMPHPNDDHPPTPIEAGQTLLRDVYLSLSADNAAAWDSTCLVVTYDEHGGFADHVPPPTLPPEIQIDGFSTLGPRVSTILASPFAEPGGVCREQFDHCSLLKLICEWQGLPPEALSRRVAAAWTRSLRLALSDQALAEAPLPPSAPAPRPAAPHAAVAATAAASATRLSPLGQDFQHLKGFLVKSRQPELITHSQTIR